MGLIKNANPDGDIKDSGYYRLVENKQIAELFRAVHSTVISNGTELEHFIESNCPYKVCKTEFSNYSLKTGKPVKNPQKIEGTTPTIETVFQKYSENENCYFPKIKVSKEDFKKYGVALKSKNNIELDGVWIVNGKIFITEIKDGSDFDTKKADGEVKMFKYVEKLFHRYNIQINIVLWNLENPDNHSVKSLEAVEYITTGKIFSEQVGLPFETIVELRRKDSEVNESHIVERMRQIVRDYDEAHN